MKRTILGILRIILIMIQVVSFFYTSKGMKSFEKFYLMSAGQKIGFSLIVIFYLNFVIYMAYNSFRDFKNETMKFKGMYIIFSIWIVVTIFEVLPLHEIPLWILAFIVIYILLSVLFVVNDFIALWIKRSKIIQKINSK